MMGPVFHFWLLPNEMVLSVYNFQIQMTFVFSLATLYMCIVDSDIIDPVLASFNPATKPRAQITDRS